MKSFLLAFLFVQSVSASTIYCRAPDGSGDLHLSLDMEERIFSFAQFCWNPCHMGQGKIIAGPMMGWSGIRYRIELTESEHLIEPFAEKTMTVLFDFDMQTAILTDRGNRLALTCKEGNL